MRAPGLARAERRRALLALPQAVALAGLLFAASSAQGAPEARGSCHATASGRGVAVRVHLFDLFQPELLRLVGLGLDGKIRVDVELLRRRPLWFSSRVAAQSIELTVSRAPQGEGFVLDGDLPLADPQQLKLARVLLPEGGDQPERHEAQVKVQLRVITPASLGKMATWVAGGGARQEERSALSAGVLALLADELSRSLEFSCPVGRR